MIHQPDSSFYEAKTGEFILEVEEIRKLRESITTVYVQRTGKPLWVVSEDMERDVFMSATEAQAHGIVDKDEPKVTPIYRCRDTNALLSTKELDFTKLNNRGNCLQCCDTKELFLDISFHDCHIELVSNTNHKLYK
ncbi:hypothetical protein GOBAR_DD10684 [Gossypium barbadense]|nr:hypothetical protein GOBAR_DD10684 [Gossypium barbadense]